ncbi:MAG: F0F1 ATP synthase subunit epsilon [Holosporaceae bacterium]|nr:F0F1 ATP synthase subunit epsilon [Holosporaceae bacterium]
MIAKILKLDKKLFDGEAREVVLPAVEGEMCLLPNHISSVVMLKKGEIKVFKPTGEYPAVFEISGGVCSFFDNKAVFIVS